ncbi:MAG: large conductance mechanosensitive channel protein MscL [Verrucomicrobiales bacterium]|jgi:large conductance mechanosensitive channel|nr:large conductance mechanosensitive channel protein MscL [Verrucomicrobiales bacterium]
MSLLHEFKQFALKGNAIDMAVGIILGAAFNNVVNSIVQDILMPPIGWMIGGVDFKDLKVIISPLVEKTATTPAKPEVAILYGQCISIVIQFLIIAFTVFMVVKVMNKLLADRFAPPADSQPK